MTLLFQATWLLPIILSSASFCLADLDVEYEWKYIDYVWESDEEKAEAVNAGSYDYTKIITNDIQPLSDGRILVTTPKYYDNPASLSTVSDQTGDGGPLLAPYPDWSWHTQTDCTGITSVRRVFLDDYDRLWLVDTGKIGNEQVCTAKILVFDTNTDELIKEFEIPSDLSHSPDDESKGMLELFAVEIVSDGTTENIWAYIADVEGYGLLIWDEVDIWRLDGEKFAPASTRSNITIYDESFYTNTGITVLQLPPSQFFDQPWLLFRPEQGPINWAAYTEDIHNSKSGTEIPWYASELQEAWVEPAKAIGPKSGVLVSGFPASGQIGCWNVQTSLVMDNVGYPAQDETTMVHISSFKMTVDQETGDEELLLTSNRYQKFVLGTMDFDEVNFRVLKGVIGDLVVDTVCDVAETKTDLTLEDIGFNLDETE